MSQSAAATKITATATSDMRAPVRVLHFADAHVGTANFGKTDLQSGLSSRVMDFLARLDEMIAFAADSEVDLVVFAGDAFRTRSPNPTIQREFAARVLRLAQLAPTVLLAGNHDLPLNAAKASSIEIFDTLATAGVWVAQDFQARRFSTRRGDMVVGAAPYPMRARLLDEPDTRGLSMQQLDDALREALHERLAALAEAADQLADDDTPRLLLGHFSLAGASWGSERGVMLGRDVCADMGSVADRRWDYVAMGHIHLHQNLTHGQETLPPVVYSGSLERIDFGEEGAVKGFCWLELARGRADWRFVQVAARELLTIDVDCRESAEPTEAVLAALEQHELQDAALRLHIALRPETEARLNEGRIMRALRAAGVFHIAGVRKNVERPARTRLGKRPEELTDLQLLSRYFESKGVDASKRAALLSVATEILEKP